MARIHHNTLKKAAANGLTIEEINGGAEGYQVRKAGENTPVLASAKGPKDALDLAILALAGDKPKVKRAAKPKSAKKPAKRRASDDEGEEGDEEDASRSVIKAKYKTKYRPHKMTCGDGLAKQVREAFMTKKDPDTGKPRLDFEAFVTFAKANDCWVEGYRSLKDRHGNRNNGMIRMNVINRLRARVKAGNKVEW